MPKEFTFFSLATRNLKRKPLRTGMLVAAIGLLVTILIFALSFVRRVDSSIKLTSDRLGADLLIVPTGSRGAAEDVLLENKVKSFYMDRDILAKVKKVEGIGNVTCQTYLVTIMGECCDVPETMVIAFNQDTDFVVKPWLSKKLGRRLGKGEAIVGSESAFNIDFGLMEVDSVLFGNLFKIVGILDKTGTGLDNAIFIDENNIDDILKKGKSPIKPGQISVIFARVKKGFDPYQVAGKIEDSVIEADAVARKDIGKGLISTLRDINRIFFITVFVASILSVFLVWAVFSAIANERSKEIGIMRAIGANERHVAELFLLEVMVIGCVGSFLGIIFGTSLSLLLEKSFHIMRNVSIELGAVERTFIALLSLSFGTAICVLGALSPLRRIRKIEPLPAMKEDLTWRK